MIKMNLKLIVYSRNNLPKVKGEGYVINNDESKSMQTHWIALYANANNITGC